MEGGSVVERDLRRVKVVLEARATVVRGWENEGCDVQRRSKLVVGGPFESEVAA